MEKISEKICLLLLSLLLFVSCSMADSEEDFEINDDSFLKSQIEAKYSQTLWTSALSPDALEEKHDTLPGILTSVRVTRDNLYAGGQDTFAPVYPYLEGFGSLDISDLSAEVRSFLDGFCASFCAQGDAYSYMEENRQYELAIFLFDLKEKWSGYPADDVALFSSYIYGKPLIDDRLFLVPIRFISESGDYIDCDIFLSDDAGEWRVSQIRAKWRNDAE